MTGLEIAGIALASLGAAEQLFDCGTRIHRRMTKEKQLNLLLRELQMFEVDDNRQMLDNYVRAAQPVLRSQLIQPADKERLTRKWERIKDQMIEINNLLDTMMQNSSILNSKARHEAQDRLRDIGGSRVLSSRLMEFRDDVSFLEKQLAGNPPTLLTGKTFNYIDADNRRVWTNGVFLCKGKLTEPTDDGKSKAKWYLAEPVSFKATEDREALKESVAILASKLQRAQPTRGLFKLVGFREELDPSKRAFELIFGGDFAENFPPSLSLFIAANPAKPSLNFRVNLCCQLATAVLEAQLLGLVHKNIRPENILVVETAQSPMKTASEDQIPSLKLVGWQSARHVAEGYVTTLSNAVTPQRKVYQHPERQLPTSEHDYSMAHDVYSLGVCMIEILRWRSILRTEASEGQPPGVSNDFVEAFAKLKFAPNEREEADRYTKYPRQNKAVLLRINETYIPIEAGDKMRHIIHGFLTCLDRKDESDDEDEEGEEEGEYVLLGEVERQEQARKFMDTALMDLRKVLCAI